MGWMDPIPYATEIECPELEVRLRFVSIICTVSINFVSRAKYYLLYMFKMFFVSC